MILNLSIPVTTAQTGQVLGVDAKNPHGDVLLARGSYITLEVIDQMKRLGVTEISVMFHPDHPQAKKLLGF